MMARQTAAARYDVDNMAAARLILAHIDHHGGPDSLMVRWARLVVARAVPKIEGPLFSERRRAA